MKTALELLGTNRFRRSYNNGMLTSRDLTGESKYMDLNDLTRTMKTIYAYNVASYDTYNKRHGFKDIKFNQIFDEYIHKTIAEIEEDALSRRLRDEGWLVRLHLTNEQFREKEAILHVRIGLRKSLVSCRR